MFFLRDYLKVNVVIFYNADFFRRISAALMIVVHQKPRVGFMGFSLRLLEVSSKTYRLQTALSYTVPKRKSLPFPEKGSCYLVQCVINDTPCKPSGAPSLLMNAMIIK